MIRLGLVDFDTSHVVNFTKRLNHMDIEEDQQVDGARVVAGWPGSSMHSPDRLPKFTQQMREMGVQIVDEKEDLMELCDGICIEANDGSVHLQRARPFLEAGMPCFVDKPFACSVPDARELIELSDKHGAPIFASSPQRFVPQIVQAADDEEIGDILGAHTATPAKEHPVNPGLYNYGIHGVEMLYALMGPGCESVCCGWSEGAEIVTGRWQDGRLGTVRGLRAGSFGYTFSVWGENGTRSEPLDRTYNHRELLKRIVQFFETGQSPVDPLETLEVIAFIATALESREHDGRWISLHL